MRVCIDHGMKSYLAFMITCMEYGMKSYELY